ncbi:MAG: 3-deoxy-manno-octulosonate cytidylyltransferase [Alphaproteobacteria bacterium]|jgi:3-deoxy-manno-octulosonate cytidylyltransferase (CMP-KDO synthetase)|nr:3-deoxy-manno-octulosonate cytidylyltransferase [Alphaproteobacteria bacterium]QQS58447.1 MAG: 3-deoxy-manno-octulosonate cytidylyltransferase [Alphaproteobacteria bacterium]
MPVPRLAIAIPARYGSSRFPGKPLAEIAGRSMLSRVVDLARRAVVLSGAADVAVFVATEDKRIAAHAEEIGVPCIMTPDTCATGSDRVLAALRQLDHWPDFIINLQGDVPFTPPSVLRKMFETFLSKPKYEVITPVQVLSWADLERLRKNKKKTPFSGTTVTVDSRGRALWFSKTILPAIRDEENLRAAGPLSPVRQHLGLYGFRADILEKFCSLPLGVYEQLEGLEQLRMLENGIAVQTVEINLPEGTLQAGIDTQEDLKRAAQFLKTHGESLL